MHTHSRTTRARAHTHTHTCARTRMSERTRSHLGWRDPHGGAHRKDLPLDGGLARLVRAWGFEPTAGPKAPWDELLHDASHHDLCVLAGGGAGVGASVTLNPQLAQSTRGMSPCVRLATMTCACKRVRGCTRANLDYCKARPGWLTLCPSCLARSANLATSKCARPFRRADGDVVMKRTCKENRLQHPITALHAACVQCFQ